MICARCEMPILPGERYETWEIEQASGPGGRVSLHADLCARTVRQSTQDDRPWQRR
jgi:hypothetical protein